MAQPDSPPATRSDDSSIAEDSLSNLTFLWKTALDAKGRRSVAYWNEKLGQQTTMSDILDRLLINPKDLSVRETLRIFDSELCWLLFEDWKPEPLRWSLMVLSIPIFAVRMGYHAMRQKWKIFREGRPSLVRSLLHLLCMPYNVVEYFTILFLAPWIWPRDDGGVQQGRSTENSRPVVIE